MTTARADEFPIETDEPFGMNGVFSWLMPLVAFCCALAAVGCILMSIRSHSIVDSFRRDASNSVLFVDSVFGRVQIAFTQGDPQRVAADYNVYSFPVGRRQDTWEPSWQKTLGIDWGDDVRAFERSRRIVAVWQIRVRWRTLALLLSLPAIVLVVKRIRRRGRRDSELAGVI